MRVQLHAPTALPPEIKPWYAWDRKVGRPQNLSGGRGEYENWPLLGVKLQPLGRPALSHTNICIRFIIIIK
jgi:hypothetical protein